MPKLDPLVKSATQKISDPEARGLFSAFKGAQRIPSPSFLSLQWLFLC